MNAKAKKLFAAKNDRWEKRMNEHLCEPKNKSQSSGKDLGSAMAK
jgi:hypothetical protein